MKKPLVSEKKIKLFSHTPTCLPKFSQNVCTENHSHISVLFEFVHRNNFFKFCSLHEFPVSSLPNHLGKIVEKCTYSVFWLMFTFLLFFPIFIRVERAVNLDHCQSKYFFVKPRSVQRTN